MFADDDGERPVLPILRPCRPHKLEGAMKNLFGVLAIAAAIFTGVSRPSYGQGYGTDTQNVLTPAAGGMAGVSLALPQDVPAAIFGNPATLSQFHGTQFCLGAPGSRVIRPSPAPRFPTASPRGRKGSPRPKSASPKTFAPSGSLRTRIGAYRPQRLGASTAAWRPIRLSTTLAVSTWSWGSMPAWAWN